MLLAAGYSRQRGQGAVEYILIMVVVLVLVGGAAWMFREPLAGLMNRFTGVLTGESSSASGTDDGASEQSSATAEDSGSDGPAGEEGGAPASGTGAEEGGAVKNKAETAETEEADLPEEGLGTSFGGGIGIWVAVGAGLFIVMIVLYFLNASKR